MKNSRLSLGLVSLFLFLASDGAFASQPEPEILRVGGDYRVASIEQMDSGSFRVEFRADQLTGSFDVLVLETDQVNFAVREDEVIRISAEVLSVQGEIAEVAQVLLFLPSPQGYLPIWLLSRKGSAFDLRGSRYLEMHAPASDYQIF